MAVRKQPVRLKSRQKGRAAWGSISREQVVEAAAQAVREGRSDQMTIRGLAAQLGVAPMSLYRHVREKTTSSMKSPTACSQRPGSREQGGKIGVPGR